MKKLLILIISLVILSITLFHVQSNAIASERYIADADMDIIESAIVQKAIVRVKMKDSIIAKDYCFQTAGTFPTSEYDWIPINSSKFQVYKYDGEYDLYVKDLSNRISLPKRVVVNSGYHYVIDHYDKDGNYIPEMKKPLVDILADNNLTIEQFNNMLYKEIADANPYTREAVAIAGVSAVSLLADLGYGVPYCANHAYQGKTQWGFNPIWGKRLEEPTFNTNVPEKLYYNEGMQCVGGVTWAYKQAGIELCNSDTTWQIGRIGETEEYRDNIIDYRTLRTGDLMQVGGHYRMIIDRLDLDKDGACDAYLSFEMDAPTMCCRIMYWDWLWYRDLFFNMEAAFKDESLHKKSDYYGYDSTIINDAPAKNYYVNYIESLYFKNGGLFENIWITCKSIFQKNNT